MRTGRRSRNMTPRLPAADAANGLRRRAILGGQLQELLPGRTCRPDGPDLPLAEVGGSVALTAGESLRVQARPVPVAGCLPPLPLSVLVVVQVCAQEQMLRPDTEADVTCMAALQ